MKFRIKPTMLSLAMVIGFTGAGAGGALAAEKPAAKFPAPDWTYTVPNNHDLGWVFSSGHVAKDRLYFNLFASDSDSRQIQSFSRKDAKNNWIYDFKVNGKELQAALGPIFSAESGDGYFLAKTDKDKSYKLYAVSPAGKLKWSQPVDVELMGNLQVQPNQHIMLTSGSMDGKQTVIYDFASDGTLKKKSSVSGVQFLKMLSNGQVVNTTGKKVEWYAGINQLKKPIFSYTLPEQTAVSADLRSPDGIGGPAIYPLKGGNLVALEWTERLASKGPGVEILDPEKIERSTTLVYFDGKGKKVWERKLPKNAFAIAAGENILVKNGLKLELYGPDNKLKASKTFAEKDFFVDTAANGEILAAYEDRGEVYVLNAKNLGVTYHAAAEPISSSASASTSLVKEPYSFLYAGKGELYVHRKGAENTVSRYTLK